MTEFFWRQFGDRACDRTYIFIWFSSSN